MARRTVLVVNLGTPRSATADEVAAFLREFLGDPFVVDYPAWLWRPLLERVILRTRPERVAAMYRSIAGEGVLPLARGTIAIAEALGRELGASFHVRPAYRYGRPAVATEIVQALRDSEEVLVLPLFPQRTSSSSETIVDVARAAATRHDAGRRVRLVRLEPTAPGYIDALAERVSRAQAEEAFDHLVVSFHGVPRRYDRREGGRYTADCSATFAALVSAARLPPGRATLSFQSRFGPEPWTTPSTFATLRSLARAGTRSVAVVMPGFLTEGLETLEEIAVRGRETFLKAGGSRFRALPALEAAPALIAALASSVRNTLSRAPEDLADAS